MLNFGVFALVVFFGEQADLTQFWNTRDAAARGLGGGLVGMTFNFLFSSKLVFDERG